MKITSLIATLCALALAVVPVAGAWAAGEPIPGIDIIIKINAGNRVVFQGTTDAKGDVTVKELAPGRYTIELGGKSPEAAKIKSGTWVVALLPVSREPTPAKPLSFTSKAVAGGAQQVEIVIPDGPAKSYKATLTR